MRLDAPKRFVIPLKTVHHQGAFERGHAVTIRWDFDAR
jgi:hypothetical protein